MSGLAGEMRLQSDFLIARDARTACEWQSFSGNMPKLQNRFQFVLETFAVVGQDQTNMIDCSEVIPVPVDLTDEQAAGFFPPGKTLDDVEGAVSSLSLFLVCLRLIACRSVRRHAVPLVRYRPRPRHCYPRRVSFKTIVLLFPELMALVARRPRSTHLSRCEVLPVGILLDNGMDVLFKVS